ncbi:MAG: arginyltransferase [Gammaproteobacteria bacterium]|nr:arginyltransferase [Gammaproteobacteria bacterium]
MTKVTHVPLAITEKFSCSYLPDKTEQLIFVQPPLQLTDEAYETLMAQGFRRSADDVYRPHCPQCNDCQSLRINVSDFIPSKSQRRLLAKNKQLVMKVTQQIKPSYYPLYQKYISVRHCDGSMYPPNEDQLKSFTQSKWSNIEFIELYHQQQLISVAIVDRTPNALSAVYTFFDPQFAKLSLGSYNILQQIEYAAQNNIKFVYLGYFIDACDSMKYKQKYLPNQRYIDDSWIIFKK